MRRITLLLPVLAGILFGSAGIFVRRLNQAGLDNMTVLFARASFATLFMLLLLLVTDRRRLQIHWRDIPLFIGTGVLGMLGINLCYTYAVGQLTLSLAAVLLSMAPLFVLFLAALLFHEPVTGRKMACTLAALVGCVLATGLLEGHASGGISSIGLLTGVGAALLYALYSICSRLATDRGYHTYTIIFYSVVCMALVTVCFTDFPALGGYLAPAPGPNLLFLMAHALCIAVLPYVFLTTALLHTEAGTVSILAAGAAEPISAVVFGVAFYGEMPTPLMLLGLAVVVFALSMLCLRPRQRERKAPFAAAQRERIGLFLFSYCRS